MIKMPVRPYPSQVVMMTKAITGIESRQHCLLESPTGSGKTLALLCACLAWQSAEQSKCRQTELSAPVEPSTPHVGRGSKLQQEIIIKKGPDQDPSSACNKVYEDLNNTCLTDKDEDDFSTKTLHRKSLEHFSYKNSKKIKVDVSLDQPVTVSKVRPLVNPVSLPAVSGSAQPTSRIFYCTRTHKQIEQVIRELRRTVYTSVKMTILSSREHSCVHPQVSKSANKIEDCRKLLDGVEGNWCRFHSRLQDYPDHVSVNRSGLQPIWDIEDLTMFGRKKRVCPYYLAKILADDADLVLCPYNYIIDPVIRSQMNIVLKDSVLVIDEAHNIEDASREALSFSFDLELLEAVDTDLQTLSLEYESRSKLLGTTVDASMRDYCRQLRAFVVGIQLWAKTLSDQGADVTFEKFHQCFTSAALLKQLMAWPVTYACYVELSSQFSKLMAAGDTGNIQSEHLPRMSNLSANFFESIFLLLSYVLQADTANADSFVLTIFRTAVLVEEPPKGRLGRPGSKHKQWTTKASFSCLNPALAFSRVAKQSRCVILASGTLSPMASFSSELGVPFNITMEAGHVVPDDQVWVGTLQTGPSSQKLTCTFQNLDSYSFQDEVGELILDICSIVPHGVLCFFPSYVLLEKLQRRWKTTGLIDRLEQKKHVFTESRAREDFDKFLSGFYHHASDVAGSVMLAVYRGKVSEGLDFSDNYARAVIAFGVPYPNSKDISVEQKRVFNNKFAGPLKLLSGSDWYKIQAYRALNQAIGRCIRHRNDWGAIILVDERYNQVDTMNRYSNTDCISKWARSKVQRFQLYLDFRNSLERFAASNQSRLLGGSHSPPGTETARPGPSLLEEMAIVPSNSLSSSRCCFGDWVGPRPFTSAGNTDLKAPDPSSSKDVCDTSPQILSMVKLEEAGGFDPLPSTDTPCSARMNMMIAHAESPQHVSVPRCCSDASIDNIQNHEGDPWSGHMDCSRSIIPHSILPASSPVPGRGQVTPLSSVKPLYRIRAGVLPHRQQYLRDVEGPSLNESELSPTKSVVGRKPRRLVNYSLASLTEVPAVTASFDGLVQSSQTLPLVMESSLVPGVQMDLPVTMQLPSEGHTVLYSPSLLRSTSSEVPTPSSSRQSSLSRQPDYICLSDDDRHLDDNTFESFSVQLRTHRHQGRSRRTPEMALQCKCGQSRFLFRKELSQDHIQCSSIAWLRSERYSLRVFLIEKDSFNLHLRYTADTSEKYHFPGPHVGAACCLEEDHIFLRLSSTNCSSGCVDGTSMYRVLSLSTPLPGEEVVVVLLDRILDVGCSPSHPPVTPYNGFND